MIETWSQLATILIAFATVMGGLHWIFMKFIVTPAIINTLGKHLRPVEQRISQLETSFVVSQKEMMLRVEEAERTHERLERADAELWIAINDVRRRGEA